MFNIIKRKKKSQNCDVSIVSVSETLLGPITLGIKGVGSIYTLLDGSNVRLNWNIEYDLNVYWIKFKKFLSLY